MLTPTVREIPRAHMRPERDDFADDMIRQPRREPYRRASQRQLVRASLQAESHHANYAPRSNRS
jgi:hypothetical protein